MTYYALTFLAAERRRQIDADYLRAIGSETVRARLGRALVAIGSALLERDAMPDVLR